MKHYCPSCTAAGRLGYCAPMRCYCRHADCYAAAHARIPEPLPERPTTSSRTGRQMAESWASREEPTWLDR